MNEKSWAEADVVDVKSILPVSDGDHVSVDEYDRLWFPLGNAGVLIFDSQGVLLGNVSFLAIYIFDALITDNYVLYLSAYSSNRVLRLDPNIKC